MYAPISESSSSNFLIRASIFLPLFVIICETRISENAAYGRMLDGLNSVFLERPNDVNF